MCFYNLHMAEIRDKALKRTSHNKEFLDPFGFNPKRDVNRMNQFEKKIKKLEKVIRKNPKKNQILMRIRTWMIVRMKKRKT